MASKKKLLQAAAGSAGGAVLDVDEVFSTYLYDGTGSAQTITNGIDLSGEGGLVWIKRRTNGTSNHVLTNTERGAANSLSSNLTNAETTGSTTRLTSFNSDGFSVGTNSLVNQSSQDHVSWTFRKAEKFFDVVTYTGNQVSGRTLSHNLGSTPGMIIIKKLDTTEDWTVFHRDLNTNSGGNYTQFVKLNANTSAFGGTGSSASTCEDVQNVSSTTFTIGNDNRVNTNTSPYVAYLFAHHNNDGEFGPNADQDIIKCGSYTGTGANNNIVNLGFEPQWLMWKNITTTGHDWHIVDTMRGFTAEGIGAKRLEANTTDVEATSGSPYMDISSTGFVAGSSSASANKSGDTYIYMAIRRGPLAEPTSATDVFGIDTLGNGPPGFQLGNPVDMALRKTVNSTSDWQNAARVIDGKFLKTNSNATETSSSEYVFDYNNGWNSSSSTDNNIYSWMWRRAPSFFDVVTYTGNDGTNTLNHNLGVVPEMIWIKARNNERDWLVYHKDLGLTKYLEINRDGAAQNFSTGIFDSTPTSTQFVPRSSFGQHNNSSYTYIAYLFASLDGISKVGSFSGNNANNRTIDCGFSNGAKLVIIKCTTNGGTQWFVFDSTRGINTGTDPYVLLNSDLYTITNLDLVEPVSSGFAVNYVSSESFNETGKDYIFYAIAA